MFQNRLLRRNSRYILKKINIFQSILTGLMKFVLKLRSIIFSFVKKRRTKFRHEKTLSLAFLTPVHREYLKNQLKPTEYQATNLLRHSKLKDIP